MALPPRGVTGTCCRKLLMATHWTSTLSTTTARHQSAGHSRPDRTRKASKPPAVRPVPRMLSADVAKFMRPRDGHLTTTPASAGFFRAHPTVEHDHGTMVRLDDDAIRQLDRAYGVRLAWSPRHVVHPHRLRFFDPRGHPLAPKLRSDLARKTRETALWAFATATGGVSAVVWQLTKRELLRAVFRGLAARGYDEHGRKADGTELHGTLWLTLWQPQHARRLPPDRFGEVVAETLDRHYATRAGDGAPAPVADVAAAKEQGRRKREVGGGVERPAREAEQWKPRERGKNRDRPVRSSAETDGSSVWQARKRG
ncbi:hypothetical protein CCM_06543 [Cordyceps militaris CM01]|uniref:Uncharacterized protein n=1 Tax=Cordyceps militaris (strain CM01) TaxID=983644 RepID=G3JMU2_CORMM|nr:uncharacterized protein CCM_06543 [Cordyceps militaris CM01]EGX90124.1 hypothetical protein CCM_06543 [Cordyceps militaris CM01]